jgi:hypothetical protein
VRLLGNDERHGLTPVIALSGEKPFPAQRDTALTGYDYLIQHEKVSPKKIIVSGDSAGGEQSQSLHIEPIPRIADRARSPCRFCHLLYERSSGNSTSSGDNSDLSVA